LGIGIFRVGNRNQVAKIALDIIRETMTVVLIETPQAAML
jgi:hypothetical protein